MVLCLPGRRGKPTRRSCLELPGLAATELWTTTGPAHPNSSFTNCPLPLDIAFHPRTQYDRYPRPFHFFQKPSDFDSHSEDGVWNLRKPVRGYVPAPTATVVYGLDADVSLPADGIHIDMNRLKAGEVK